MGRDLFLKFKRLETRQTGLLNLPFFISFRMKDFESLEQLFYIVIRNSLLIRRVVSTPIRTSNRKLLFELCDLVTYRHALLYSAAIEFW